MLIAQVGVPLKGATALAARRAQLTTQFVYRLISWTGTSLASGTVSMLSSFELSEVASPTSSVHRSARVSMLIFCLGIYSKMPRHKALEERRQPGDQDQTLMVWSAWTRASLTTSRLKLAQGHGDGALKVSATPGKLASPLRRRLRQPHTQSVLHTGGPNLHLAV